MTRFFRFLSFVVSILLAGCLAVLTAKHQEPPTLIKNILEHYREDARYTGLSIGYPFNETLFPPEITAPTFRWKDRSLESDTWLITIDPQDENNNLSYLSKKMEWTPADTQWERIKHRTLGKKTRVSILGFNHMTPDKILSGDSISIQTSSDEVGAPIFYREVNLPFIDAVKDPSRIKWRFGSISTKTQPPVIMENLPVCGNCHSFSADGSILGMDVDYANEKGSYALLPIDEEIVINKSKIITWSDFERDKNEPTYGLLSQVSPDGRYVVSTVKDRSVFVARDDIFFSQLFFPVKGILAFYSRDSDTFKAIPGTNDKRYVQSNPTWSPDGKVIVFTRAKAYDLKTKGNQVLLSQAECRQFLEGKELFLFDLYRIPFNKGKGGNAEPLKGASHNGMSNYFPKYSPDGKWIVFCKAKSFSLLQPDSELFIMPAGGGKPRRMRCNTNRMNSWHSISPNGRWMVFTSKVNSAYTQLFLTHLDENGNSTPPVLLSRFTSPDRAANIPEFVNLEPGGIKRIEEKFLDDLSFIRAANEFQVADDLDRAEDAYRKALEYNPDNSDAINGVGTALGRKGRLDEAVTYFRRAIELDPNNIDAYHNMGIAMSSQDKWTEALVYYKKALQLEPQNASTLCNVGLVLSRLGRIDEAVAQYKASIDANPDYLTAYNNLGNIYSSQGLYEEAIPYYLEALERDKEYLDAHMNLAITYLTAGRYDDAIIHFQEALRIKPDLEPAQVGLEKALQLKKK